MPSNRAGNVMKLTSRVTSRGKGVWGRPREFQLATIATTRWSQDKVYSHVATSYKLLVPTEPSASRSFRSEAERATFLASSFFELELVDLEPGESVERSHPLCELLGGELVGVHFVRDYVQLQFDPGGMIHLYVWPRMYQHGSILRRGDPGYNDVVVSAIGKRLTVADEILDLGLVFELDGGVRFTIPLDGTELVGAEAAMFDGEGWMMVWRPGDELVDWLPCP